MDDQPHWVTIAKCILCEKIPKYGPMFQCPHRHQYCSHCIEELKRRYTGNINDGATCVLCKTSGIFARSKFNTEFLNKLLAKPSIDRPSRVHRSRSSNVTVHIPRSVEPDNEVTVEGLFQLPSDKVRELLKMDPSSVKVYSPSKVPIECPHTPCRKTVASSAFVTHFYHEHQDLPKYNTELGKELCMPFDATCIDHDASYCIAIISVYEKNNIDINYSKSSRSVINACNKFNSKIPVNTFWLMVAGSPKNDPSLVYACLWLFNATQDTYRCTIELSSRHDSTCFSTQCEISTIPRQNLEDVVVNLNCLLLSKEYLTNLLREGPCINLRITVH